jgi:hypothetical protein
MYGVAPNRRCWLRCALNLDALRSSVWGIYDSVWRGACNSAANGKERATPAVAKIATRRMSNERVVNSRTVETLRIGDLEAQPVWEYSNLDADDETELRPAKQLPVTDASNKIFGTRIRLANGTELWALVGNVSLNDTRATKHFITLSVARDGVWF